MKNFETNKIIREAWQGSRGPHQKRIVDVGFELISKLLRKNSDYGSSVFEAPLFAPDMDPGDGILVRMSDKLARLNNLLDEGGGLELRGDVGETLSDTLDDLLGYWLLYQARPEEEEKRGSFTIGPNPGEELLREVEERLDREEKLSRVRAAEASLDYLSGLSIDSLVSIAELNQVLERDEDKMSSKCPSGDDGQNVQKCPSDSRTCKACSGDLGASSGVFCFHCEELARENGKRASDLSKLGARKAREMRELGEGC